MPLIAIIGALGAEAAAAAAAAPALAAAAAAPTLAAVAAPTVAAGLGTAAAETAATLTAEQLAAAAAQQVTQQATTAGISQAAAAAPQAAAAVAPEAAALIPAGPGGGIATAIPQGGTTAAEAAANQAISGGGGYTAAIPQGGTLEAAQAGEAATGSAFERGITSALKFTKDYPIATSLGLSAASSLMSPKYEGEEKKQYKSYEGKFKASEPSTVAYNPIYQPTPYAVGGPVEEMSAQNALGQNTGYPMAGLQSSMYANPQVQRPIAGNVVSAAGDAPVSPYTGEAQFAKGGDVDTEEEDAKQAAYNRKLMGIKNEQEQADTMETLKAQNAKGMGAGKALSRTQQTYSPMTAANKEYAALAKKYGIPVAPTAKTSVDVAGDTDDTVFANGGIAHGLGGYSDGGRLLKGPGDGVSDSIPAVIGNKQPARLADGEFVIPARIVSELGNGSTEAGARQLYAMMARIQSGRKKSIGKNKVAVNSKANKHLPK